MAIVRIKEIIGVSPHSFDDALKQAIERITQKEGVTGVKIINWSLDIKEGRVVAYKVNLKYAYTKEE